MFSDLLDRNEYIDIRSSFHKAKYGADYDDWYLRAWIGENYRSLYHRNRWGDVNAFGRALLDAEDRKEKIRLLQEALEV